MVLCMFDLQAYFSIWISMSLPETLLLLYVVNGTFEILFAEDNLTLNPLAAIWELCLKPLVKSIIEKL